MHETPNPSISSFVIRFVQDHAARETSQPAYRGYIRHVQTDHEIMFTQWEDAVAFMQNYVPIETEPPAEIELDGK